MPRTLTVLVSMLVLVQSADAQSEPGGLQAQVARLTTGARLEIVFKDQHKAHGKMVSYGDFNFRITGAHKSVQQINYADVASVRETHSNTGEVAGIISGMTIALVVVLFFVLNHRPEKPPG